MKNKIKMFIAFVFLIIMSLISISCANSKMETIIKTVDTDTNNYQIVSLSTAQKNAYLSASIIDLYENKESGNKVFDVVCENGRNGSIEIAVLVNNDKVKKIAVINHQETENHANKVFKDSFYNQFIGVDLSKKLLKSGGKPDVDVDIVVISGSTITSNAVLDCINAIAFYIQNN